MNAEVNQIVFGDRNGDRMILEITDRMHPDADDYWDGNWLSVTLDVVAGPWRGATGIGLHLCELQTMRERLRDAYQHLDRKVVFTPMENDFSLEFVGDGRGHVTIRGTARDAIGTGEISFSYHLDQTYLPGLIAQIKNVEDSFPVV